MNTQPDHFLVQGREAEGKHLTFDLPGIEPECAADGRVINVDQLSVQSQVARVPGIIIPASNEFLRVAIWAENIGRSPVEFDSVRHDHVRDLSVKAIVSNGAHGYLPVTREIVQLSAIAFPLQPKAAVL